MKLKLYFFTSVLIYYVVFNCYLDELKGAKY